MERDRAAQLVGEIVAMVANVRERLVELYTERGWLALGYPTWSDLCAAEFSDVAIGRLLPREQRAELVTHLSAAHMPTRAISDALGVNQSTVVRDKATDANASVGGDYVIGLDGKRRHASVPRSQERTAMERKDKRTGATTWSRRVQTVSAKCPMADLADDEVSELLGAAEFLANYCRGELITREGS